MEELFVVLNKKDFEKLQKTVLEGGDGEDSVMLLKSDYEKLVRIAQATKEKEIKCLMFNEKFERIESPEDFDDVCFFKFLTNDLDEREEILKNIRKYWRAPNMSITYSAWVWCAGQFIPAEQMIEKLERFDAELKKFGKDGANLEIKI